jgi:hypothetical protein
MRERRLAAALLAGAAFLLLEIRFEHREVLGETWHAWIPLASAALLILLGVPAWLLWRKGGRKLLLALFAAAATLGPVGAWFHSDGRPLDAVLRVAAAWTLKPGASGGEKPGRSPPALAPLAFSGLGLLGVLVCAGDRKE